MQGTCSVASTVASTEAADQSCSVAKLSPASFDMTFGVLRSLCWQSPSTTGGTSCSFRGDSRCASALLCSATTRPLKPYVTRACHVRMLLAALPLNPDLSSRLPAPTCLPEFVRVSGRSLSLHGKRRVCACRAWRSWSSSRVQSLSSSAGTQSGHCGHCLFASWCERPYIPL